MVRVRFAPSPTGNPHLGNIRTALFTYLFARKNNGKFILRIEDTDKSREIKESVDIIPESLKWLGFSWDEGPIRQSERFDIYKKHAKILLDKNLAYESDNAIYFKVPKEDITSWVDMVNNKKISFENKTQVDFVILRSNEVATYHLAATVDDHLMEITHVTRGEDWISSTPKHIMLYSAFGWQIPQFAHFPNILASDRSKLSKRHGAIGLMDFKKDGFLPEAIVNFLGLLGWTPPSGKEILSIEEMIREFDFQDVHSSPAVFDPVKLEWLNGEYIRKTQNSKLKLKIWEYLRELSAGALSREDHPTEEEIGKVVPLIKDRIKKLSDFVPLTDFLYQDPDYDLSEWSKLRLDQDLIKKVLEMVVEKLEVMGKGWQSERFEKTFRELAKDLGISASEIFQIIRLAVSGKLVTPPLFESIQILGEEEALKRIRQIASKFPNIENLDVEVNF